MARNDSEAGVFSVFRSGRRGRCLDLICLFTQQTIQCVQGQLTLMTSTTVVGLSLDGSGCLAIDSPHDGISNQRLGRRRM